MNEIVKPVIQWIGENTGWTVAIVIFIFSMFFEISKIKIYPITAVLKWLGNRFTGGLKELIMDLKQDTNNQIADLKTDTERKIQELNTKTTITLNEIKTSAQYNCQETQRKLQEIEQNQDRQAASRIKAHVLNFSRSLRMGEKHTEEDFKNLIKENEEYERLIKKNNWTNAVYKADYEFFYHEFQRCQRENDFLR